MVLFDSSVFQDQFSQLKFSHITAHGRDSLGCRGEDVKQWSGRLFNGGREYMWEGEEDFENLLVNDAIRHEWVQTRI